MKKTKRRANYLLLLLILFISVGYAILQSNLTITGTTSIQDSKWDIHWNNVQITTGSVSTSNADKATIDNTKTTVNYNIVLDKPGDFYEFTVDAVNEGSIDGMIDAISSKLNNVEITTLPAYLNYSITYSDGTSLQRNQELKANSSETYKVRIEYKRDIEANQLPETTQTLNLSFSVTYKQANEDAVSTHPYLYNVLKYEGAKGTYAKKYTRTHRDSFTEEPSKDIYYWHADGPEDVTNKDNVLFAGICWQMFRTTDTGGVKLLFNGYENEGTCYPEGEDIFIGKSSYNIFGPGQNIYHKYASVAYVGYMYDAETLVSWNDGSDVTSGSLFGTGVTYSNDTYTLTNVSTTYDATHHYTCNNTTGTCSTVRYYYISDFYIEIYDGRTIEDCVEDMLSADNVNQTNSTIKSYIDYWYDDNLIDYTDRLEDVIFCNDRSISDLGGWNPNGGGKNQPLTFNGSYFSENTLICTNEIDKFSKANPKAKLTYPIGLITATEAYIINHSITTTPSFYWTMTPFQMDMADAGMLGIIDEGYIDWSSVGNAEFGVRPVISLKPGTMYTSGDGSKNSPYVVE